MSFNIEGYNTEKQNQQTSENKGDLIELDVFEKCTEKEENQVISDPQLDAIRKHNEHLRKELEEYGQLQAKLASVQKKTEKENESPKELTSVNKPSMSKTDNSSEKSQTYGKQSEQTSDTRETVSDIVESTLDVFEGLGSSIQQLTGTTSKLKQVAHNAWSLKQDREIKKKFKNCPKVNVGDYTFRVNMKTKELMLDSYQGPDTILKLPSSVKGMPITAINPDFLLFRAPKALLNTVKGETIGKDLDSIKQCMTCVEQLRLPEHLRYLPSGLFTNCSTLDVVVIPKTIIGVSSMFLDGSNVKRIVFEGKCPAGLKHANIPVFTKISCRRNFFESYNGILNLSVM